MTSRIIPRSEWGAKHAAGFGPAPLPAQGVWAHHSVTLAPDLVAPYDDDAAAVRTLERIGQQRFGGGISYTFAITPAGLVFEGHGVARRGAHTKGLNTTHRAIVFVGNYETAQLTPEQVESAAWLLAHGYLSGWWKAAKFVGGHKGAPGAATSCPGRNVMSALGAINARAAAIASGAATLPAAPVPAPTAAPSTSTHAVQTLLAAAGLYTGKVDGIDGPLTRAAVKAWQTRLGLTADGVWGPATQAATDAAFAALAAAAASPPPPAAPAVDGAALARVEAEVARRPTIRRNDAGPAVVELWDLLEGSGMREPGMRDARGRGVFGDLTDKCVRDYQRSRGLGVDGVVGPSTWRSLIWEAIGRLR